MIGLDRLHPPYAAFVAGAARATQMLEILRHAADQDDVPVTPATGTARRAGCRSSTGCSPILRAARSRSGSSR
jgi:hypothetical protein